MKHTFPSWIFYTSLVCMVLLGSALITGNLTYGLLLEEKIAYLILLFGTFIFTIDRIITTYKKYKGYKIKIVN